ncbi:MAG TPA: HEAT repeat domain-containing protein [Thermoanaerobaculia bacterium]|nr:HEAT repeat domain-containing protein [Thermoanaerobaculia bacterium]
MAGALESVREFVLHIEKTLTTRRLYHQDSVPWRESLERLAERAIAAAGSDGLALRVTASDMFLDKLSMVHRPKHEDCFFFPLYRDGLRELTLAPDVSRADLAALLGVFEQANRSGAPPGEDTVSLLWRAGLSTITHNAIDGIGDMEGGEDETSRDDFGALAADLAAKISNPAIPVTGQQYSFVLDGDVRVNAQDLRYDSTTMRRAFEETPAVLLLTESEAAQIRAEVDEDRDASLLGRFIDILIVILRSPLEALNTAAIAPVFSQLAEGYWNGGEYDRSAALLIQLAAASRDAPRYENRRAAKEVLSQFLTNERLGAIVEEIQRGGTTYAIATQLWDLVPDDQLWPLLLDAFCRVSDGAGRTALIDALRRRVAGNFELLSGTLGSPDPSKVRAALALLDDRSEKLFVRQLIALASHPDEAIRLKGLAAAGRFGTPSGLEALWKAMESDPSKSVRLYAFRTVALSNLPGLAARLRALVTDAQFAARPAWEREKYVRLLGTVEGAAAEALFESWIPVKKRWIWQPKDLETLELAIRGLAACGDHGLEKVEAIVASGGKPGEVARKVLDSISRAEIGQNTFMRSVPIPEGPGEPSKEEK